MFTHRNSFKNLQEFYISLLDNTFDVASFLYWFKNASADERQREYSPQELSCLRCYADYVGHYQFAEYFPSGQAVVGVEVAEQSQQTEQPPQN